MEAAIAEFGWVVGLLVSLPWIMKQYKRPVVQMLLPKKWQWKNLNVKIKILVVFGFSMAGAAGAALSQGQDWKAAIMGGLVAGLGAMGAREAGVKWKENPSLEILNEADENTKGPAS